MAPAVIGFDWDGGNRDKCQKHGVSIAVIESLFHSPIDIMVLGLQQLARYQQRSHFLRRQRLAVQRGV
jgi:uncharacterized DUF497 family protein